MQYFLFFIFTKTHFFQAVKLVVPLKTRHLQKYWLSQVEQPNSCQYLQMAQYRVSCKQGAMPILDSWFRAGGWRDTGIVQTQSWEQVLANNRLWSNASTEPVQISVLAWHRCPVRRQYRWITSSQVTFRSRAGGRPCLCQYRVRTATPTVLAR